MINYAEEGVKNYFKNNRWNALKNSEGEIIFYKNRDPTQIKNYEFLDYSKKGGLISPSDIVSQLVEFFESRNYKRIPSYEIVRPKDSSTFFITSGIQYFEDSLLKGDIPQVTDSLFVQPVIRTNYVRGVGEGNVSSFVNPSTIRFNCNPEKYVEDLDSWMVFLSKMGLYLGDFNFRLQIKKKEEDSQNPWKKNEGFVVSCSYGGLDLGDAGYCSIPNLPNKPFEDIGFGLERLLWARNKTPTFKDIVGAFPYAFQQDMRMIDTFRTLSLMAMSDIDKTIDCMDKLPVDYPGISVLDVYPGTAVEKYGKNKGFYHDGDFSYENIESLYSRMSLPSPHPSLSRKYLKERELEAYKKAYNSKRLKRTLRLSKSEFDEEKVIEMHHQREIFIKENEKLIMEENNA